MSSADRAAASKVPAVTLGFWVIKILATTLGETGGDTFSMSLKLGYLVSSGIFLAILVVFIAGQIAAKRFVRSLYWATIVASTMAGTTMADFATRSLGVGYLGGSLLLALCVVMSLGAWRLTLGRVEADTISSPKAELFYWLTITLTQTLGTALGDWTADTASLGYLGAALIFAGLLAAIGGLYFWTPFNRVALFWSAFILTRPLGAAVGDFLDKPLDHGGLALSRPIATAVLAAIIVLLVVLLPQRSGRHPASAER
ncbi:membrane protein [soil metagenome]